MLSLSFSCQVINAFFLMLMAKQNNDCGEHIYVLPSYLAVLWDRGIYDHWLYTKVYNITGKQLVA